MKFSSCSFKKNGKVVTKSRGNALTVVWATHKSTQRRAPSSPALTEALLGPQPHKQERVLSGGTRLSLSAGNMMVHVSKKISQNS